MSSTPPAPPATDRILVRLRSTGALRAAGGPARLEPLYDTPGGGALGVSGAAEWYIARLEPDAASPWDLAHARLADRLGVAESDIVFAEPDIIHDIYPDDGDRVSGEVFQIGEKCGPVPQEGTKGRPVGPIDGWHLRAQFSGLERAREAVDFTEPRTRIAHLDTGYYREHVSTPAHVLRHLERNFVPRDVDRDSAQDPDNRVLLLDNSGHGTGTLGILAGGAIPELNGTVIGGAPNAEILPLRIADSVVLLRTSQFAQALGYAVDQNVDVVTMSMGGLPSRVWREAVDRAYMAGVCVVSAAGNNYYNLPTRHLVYPARYGRVIAACGVMADGRPYTGLKTMQGNFGPDSVMQTAMAAYTPNIPWAVFGCPDRMRMNGAGTSSATPQIAAAAALWLEKYKHELPRDWRRVEAVRNALFSSARQAHARELGRGILNASAALEVRPVLGLEQTKSDPDSFAWFRVITGLGFAEPPPREQMFNLELAQRWLLNPELQEIVPDPDAAGELEAREIRRVMEALIEDEGTSTALRRHLVSRYAAVAGTRPPSTPRSARVVPQTPSACEPPPPVPSPATRRLRAFALDPSLSNRLETAHINEVTLEVPWDDLEGPGPVGEYLEVVDEDAAGTTYPPVDLDDPRLLARDGWAPAEGNPLFHQQMVYAVAMNTIGHFERALGRPVLWRPREGDRGASEFVPRLRIRPHGLHQPNAYYSPSEIALLFGYFEASPDSGGDLVPGSRIYTCLSHDIIVHETTHAILDGMHRRFNEPSNPDVLALHEAFADIVALMQHFTLPGVLVSEIARTRGDLEAESILGSLAVQFGRGMGRGGALREAIGAMEDGKWKRLEADPAQLEGQLLPHSRGAILVAAVFDAFIAIYRSRTSDLMRIYTGGTGILPGGAIHPDLVGRLAEEAAKSADHVLTMCIRALDYLPPVDVTFFEFLRALITADSDLVREDRHNYRVAFVEAFRRRGIYPVGIGSRVADVPRSLAVDTLKWQGVERLRLSADEQAEFEEQAAKLIEPLKRFADACLYLSDRAELFATTVNRARSLKGQLRTAFSESAVFASSIGIDPEHDFEVHELRRAIRVAPRGQTVPQVIVSLTQSRKVPADDESGTPAFTFTGGSTIVVDLSVPEIAYSIVKNVSSSGRQERTAGYVRQSASDPLHALFFDPERLEPFAALHSLAEDGG